MVQIEETERDKAKRNISKMRDMLEGKIAKEKLMEEAKETEDEIAARETEKKLMEDITISDNSGNTLVITSGREVLLFLKSQKRPRKLGRFSEKYQQFWTWRSISKNHLHRKSDSWGFNYQCLVELKKLGITKVLLEEVSYNNQYYTSIDNILENGKFLFFKQQGFEKQIFLERGKFYCYPQDK